MTLPSMKVVTGGVMTACVVVILLALVYDLLPVLSAPKGDTISEITLAWWQRRPIIPLVIGLGIGIALGHLGWPQFPKVAP